MPEVPGKPGEFAGRPADHQAPGGLVKTTQLKDDSGRIEKGVGMGTADLDLLVLAGDHGTAGTATNSLYRFDSRLLVLLAGGPMLSSFSTIDPQKDRMVIDQLHGSRQQWPQSWPEWYAVPAGHRL